MPQIPIAVQRLHPGARLPEYQTPGAAGADLYACLDNPLALAPHTRVMVPTGLAIEVPPGYEAQVRPRSGLAAKHGIGVPNSPGTIDSDYRGEVKVILINMGSEDYEIHHGDRIAQMVIAPVVQGAFKEVENLSDTERGEGGFGSTGVRKS
ncbi:MAG: dUTP diphosphatase [Chrysiogenetes bacterium]|nr:dUTP diphosphatase [Chrysiogenetes bacterium]